MTQPFVRIGVAHCARPGERVSGDRSVTVVHRDRAMIGVIDGLGHGSEAAEAAEAASEVIDSLAHLPVDALLHRCHERLRRTRGAAITLMAMDVSAGLLEWVGVGNVAAALFQSHPSGELRSTELLVRSGVVGVSLPSVQVSGLPVGRGDFLVAATDGLRRDFLDSVRRYDSPQALADRLLAAYQRLDDDALVLVASLETNGL